MRTITLALLLSLLAPLVADEPKPPMLTPEEQKLAAEAEWLHREGTQLYLQGKPAAAVEKVRQALEIRRKLYPAAKYPDGHPHLAASLSNLGVVMHAIGQAGQALSYARDAVAMNRKLYPASKYADGHSDIAQSLNSMGLLLEAMGQAEEAGGFHQQALDMCRKLHPAAKFPDGHPDLAQSLNNVGSVMVAMGQVEQARGFYQQALDMYRTLYPAAKYPDGHRDLATSLNNLGHVLAAMGQAEQARGFFQQALDMNRTLYPAAKYPDGHPRLANSLNSIGFVLSAMGQAEQASGFFQQVLDMCRKLYPAAKYPDGHPDLATSLNNMGGVLQDMGQAEQARGFYQQARDMNRQLYPAAKYPNGHPNLAESLNNLGFVLQAMGQAEEARGYYQLALDMRQKLYPAAKYPDGHPRLAISLNSMGFVLNALGQAEEAHGFLQRALHMRQKLYPGAKFPDGHPDLAISLNNLGLVLEAMGQAEQALPFGRDVLAMQQRLLRRELATASEEAAFDKMKAEPLYRDFYLRVTRSTGTSAAEVVAQLWPSRAMVTRLLEQRQANARAANSELGAKLDTLRGLRRRLDQLLQDTRLKPEERDKLLTSIANQRDALERELAEKIPAWKKWRAIDDLGPADLAKALPPGAVFIDLIRYTHFEFVDKKQKSTSSYVAFVLAKDRPVQRIDFDEPALAIDKAVSDWQTAIDQRGSSASADWLREKVWGRLAPHIPEGTTTLYLAADGDLARMPWAALPTGNGRVLLEDYAVGQVPHGTFLLDQLLHPPKYDGPESLLTVGGVDYGGAKLEFLPGTVTETSAVAAIAPGKHVGVTGKEATAEKLHALMPQARYVHLATHGQFNAVELTKERQRAAKALESGLMGDESRRIGAKNPLGYVGILLADGKALSGLGIVDLPLQNTRLVTLSACETGLGALTGGEGVQGLQRAFHLAGCPNVVASLWKVNDAATAALMAKFYHEMWVNKKPPIEALREAQLTIYRHPERIPALAGERGKPDFAKTVELKPDLDAAAGAQGSKRTPTKLWAAFVLSGVGK